jgi:hypothetical protein
VSTKVYNITEISFIQGGYIHRGEPLRRTYTFDTNPTESEIFNKILLFEKEARPMTDWGGEIDTHHIFFEGLQWNNTYSAYTILWGS